MMCSRTDVAEFGRSCDCCQSHYWTIPSVALVSFSPGLANPSNNLPVGPNTANSELLQWGTGVMRFGEDYHQLVGE